MSADADDETIMKSMWDGAKMLVVCCALLPVHAQDRAKCAPILGTEELWSKPALHFVVVGEMHGTNETPAIFRDLVCSARGLNRQIIVGLEFSEQAAVDGFMASTNDDFGVNDLLSTSEWKQSDGRTSQAMLVLLGGLRDLKREGLISRIIAFSVTKAGDTASKREERMALALVSAARGNPNSLTIALTGNVHARKNKGAEVGPYPLMASFLPGAETVSLFVTDQGGEAWNCQGDGCGPHKLSSSGGVQRQIKLSATASPLAGFDGVLSTGLHATASEPAHRNSSTTGMRSK